MYISYVIKKMDTCQVYRLGWKKFFQLNLKENFVLYDSLVLYQILRCSKFKQSFEIVRCSNIGSSAPHLLGNLLAGPFRQMTGSKKAWPLAFSHTSYSFADLDLSSTTQYSSVWTTSTTSNLPFLEPFTT